MLLFSEQERDSNEQLRKFEENFECKMPVECTEEYPIKQENLEVMDKMKEKIAKTIQRQHYVNCPSEVALTLDRDKLDPMVEVECFVGEKLLACIKTDAIIIDPDGYKGITKSIVSPQEGYTA